MLNTIARIQANCNGFRTDNVISQDLLSQLDIEESYEIRAMGECDLKGRQKKINLYSIARFKLNRVNSGYTRGFDY